MTRAATVVFVFLTAVTASAQRPIFDPDEFLDPRATGGRPVLISRLVTGVASDMTGDGFRPLGENAGYVHLANSFYWGRVQFDYKRSEMRAEDGEAARWNYDFQADQYQQTRNATPKSKDTLQAGWYWPAPASGGIPVMLRSRVTFTTQEVDTDLVVDTDFTRMSSRERTIALDTDTWFRIAGREVFGSLAFSERKTSGAPINPNDETTRDERTLTYTNRFPSLSYNRAKILVRPTLTIGALTNRHGSTVNLINPAIELFRPFVRSGVNLHVIWSPQWSANADDCKVTNQFAVLIDRALFVKVF